MTASTLEPSLGHGSRRIRETSGVPSSAAQRIALRLLETFFRRPLLHLTPLVILLLLGVLSVAGSEKQYESEGVLNATSGTLLNELTGSTPSFGYESVSAVTARNLQQLLTTEAFVADVISRAGLTTAVNAGLVDADDVRQSIVANPRGDNLVAVQATTASAEQSRRLAQATLDGFVEYVVSNDIADATVRIETYEQIRDGYLTSLTTAINDLNEFVATHPAGNEENRPVDESLAITRLQSQADRASDAYQEAEQNVNEARLTANVARTVVARQLRIIDAPALASQPVNGLRSAAVTIVVFFILGLILSMGFLVVRALLDRSIRTPDELESRFGVEVLAIVPTARV